MSLLTFRLFKEKCLSKACSKFWHQTFRWPLTSASNYLCRDIGKLPRPSLIERYTNTLCIYLLSGIMHVTSDRLMGVAPRDSGSIIFFPTITIFYIIEDGVQELWRRITGNTASDAGASTPLWKRIVGYAWVISWMCICMPWYNYPSLRVPAEKVSPLPFSLVERAGMQCIATIVVASAPILHFVFGTEI